MRRQEYSKRLVGDIRRLLWVVTLGGLILAGASVALGYTGSLPWISALVGLPWAAHGTVCTAYLGMAKSDHREGGITYEAAKARNFEQGEESPEI